MTLKQAFIYTVASFTLICLASYIAFGQSQKISMQEALTKTLANNRAIKVGALEVDKAEQQTLIAKSQALPYAGITGQLSHYVKAPAFFGFDNSGGNSDKIPYSRFGGKDQASASLFISQPVYNAGIRPGIQYAKLSERSEKLSVKSIEINTAAVLRQTYIQALVLHERIKLQQESLQRNEKALQDARSLLAQGRALRVDTLRAYTSVKNLEPDLLKLTYAVKVTKQRLKTLMGIDSLQEIELTDSLVLPVSAEVLSESDVYNEAKLHRPDLQSLDLDRELSQQQIRLAAAPMKPSVSLNAQYLLQTQVKNFNYFSAFYPSTPFIGAQVLVPIFSGNANKARVKQAGIQKDQSEIRLKNAYEDLKADVKQVVADVHETSDRIQTRANVRETATLSYDITQYRYAKGVASRLELTDAELALTTAQSNYLEAVYDYLVAQIALDRIMGKSGKKD